MEYDIPRKLFNLLRLPNFVVEKNKKTFNRKFAWNFKSSRVGKEEINITNILSAEGRKCARVQSFVSSARHLI